MIAQLHFTPDALGRPHRNLLHRATQASRLFPDAAIIPVVYKVADFHWREYGPGVGGTDELWAKATGFAVAPVDGSLLYIVEYDDPAFGALLRKSLLGLAETFIHRRGDHGSFIVRLPHALPNVKVKKPDGGELGSGRGAGRYQVIYGLHPTGGRYINNGKPPITLTAQETAILVKLLEIDSRRPAPVKPSESSTVPVIQRGDLNPRQQGWLSGAVQNELADLARTVEGSRNDQLNDSLFNLFIYADMGLLDESEFVTAATAIISRSGLLEKDIQRTLESARKAAQGKTKSLPAWWNEPPRREPEAPASHYPPVVDAATWGVTSEPALEESSVPEGNEAPAAPLDYWQDGLPNSVRAAIGEYMPDPLGPVIELVAEATKAGLRRAGTAFTVTNALEWAEQLGRGVTERTIRVGLKADQQTFLTVLQTEDSYPSGSEEFPIGKSVRNLTPGGRAPEWYQERPVVEALENLLRRAACRIWERCNPAEKGKPLGKPKPGFFVAVGYSQAEAEALAGELEQALAPVFRRQGHAERFTERQARGVYSRLKRSLGDRHSTSLPPGWTYRNVGEYRAVLARAIKEASPERDLSLKEWASALGISQRSVPTVLDRAGISSLVTYQERVVTSPAQVQEIGYEIKGYPRAVISAAPGEKPVEHSYDPDLVAQHVAAGREVIVKYQTVNKQTIVTTGQPAPVPRQDRYSLMTARELYDEWASLPKDRRDAFEARIGDAADKLYDEVERRGAAPEPPPAEARDCREASRAPYFGPGYDPGYVRAWLLQALDLSRGYSLDREGRLLDLSTGEVTADQPSDHDLVDLLRGKPVSPSTSDDLIDYLVNELGGTVAAVEYHGDSQP